MPINKLTLIELLQNVLSKDAIKQSMIFIDTKIHSEGTEVTYPKTNFTYPYDGFMVFVDLKPELNWGHDCLYLFIKSDLSQLTKVKSTLPPYQGDYPETYSLMLRYGSKPNDEHDFNPFNL